MTYKCHIDGLNQLDNWTGKTENSARNLFFYYEESKLQAVRWNQWKLHFATRTGYYGTKAELEIPWFFNIRQDPFESYDQAPGPRALVSQEHSGIGNIIITLVGEHLSTFKEFPPRQEGASLNIDSLMEKMMRSRSAQ
ncbi:hypothetical protein [Variovorax sp. J22R115]|uniref:hypothetical protein n=1 Tax=Variovorax sp. J22R115 TaxID=3053509 RepID=UPI00257577AD|nr:hypothetical protein [Variovorax sp. J22R115]MDM0047447.1 hypothetical protein [Variovorax sp. J22R115]